MLGFTGAWWGAILAYWLIGMVILAVLVPALAIALVLRAGGWLTERPWPRIGRALNMGAGALFGVALIAGQLLERI